MREFNFSPNHLEKYRLGLPFAGPTGLGLYSGMFFGRTLPLSRVYSKKIPMHGREFSGEFTLPPYSGVFYTHQVAGTKKNYMFLNEKKDFLARKEKAQKEQNSYKALLAKEKKSNSQKAK